MSNLVTCNIICSTIMEFKNSPRIINGNFKFYCSRNNHGEKITNLSKLKIQIVYGDVYLEHLHLKSLHGIGRTCFTQIDGGTLQIRNTIRSNILGILLIKNLEFVKMDNNFWDKIKSYDKQTQSLRLEQALVIVNKHLQTTRDLLECQEDLVSHDLKEFAKL